VHAAVLGGVERAALEAVAAEHIPIESWGGATRALTMRATVPGSIASAPTT
jgi:hypothetical protein